MKNYSLSQKPQQIPPCISSALWAKVSSLNQQQLKGKESTDSFKAELRRRWEGPTNPNPFLLRKLRKLFKKGDKPSTQPHYID